MRLPALLLVLALAAPVHADGFDPRDDDKQAHMAASYAITLTVAIVARRCELPRWQAAVLGAATALAVGTIKELTDEPYAWGDQAANTVGASAAVGLVFAVNL